MRRCGTWLAASGRERASTDMCDGLLCEKEVERTGQHWKGLSQIGRTFFLVWANGGLRGVCVVKWWSPRNPGSETNKSAEDHCKKWRRQKGSGHWTQP